MNCINCRREISDGSNFCPYCGTTQPAAGAAPATPATPTAPPATPMGGVRSSPSVPAGTHSQSGVPGGAPLPGASQRATMAMILGIASLVVTFFCCICLGLGGLVGTGLGLTAFIMGRNELEDIAGGFASPAGQSSANLGKTLGMIGMIVGVLGFVGYWFFYILGAVVQAS